MTPDLLDELLRCKGKKQPVVLATNMVTGEQHLIRPSAMEHVTPALQDAAEQALRSDKPTVVTVDDQDIFLNVFNPPLRLVIVGAVHIAQPLAIMARAANFAVTVVDPRTAFASQDRFPDTHISNDWPDEALNELALDTRTAVVALTHDPKIDDPALDVALKSSCFYIGALGSKKTHASRLERLGDMAHDERTLARIHGPIGLAINAKSPSEIAISIMAEIVSTLRNAPAP